MRENWFWIGKYLVVIVVALVLGSVLAGLEPFKGNVIGSTRISAGALVQFIAHGGALALFWALGLRFSGQLRRAGGPASPLSAMVLALFTLIAVASAYGVLAHFLAPLLTADARSAIDWVFIAGILAAALWLLWVLFTESEAVLEALGRVAAQRRSTPASPQTPPQTPRAPSARS